MELLHGFSKTALKNRHDSKYKAIAFDGCFFYFTCPNLHKIVKYDTKFCEVECFNTSKPYSCICYDSQENCFWVSSDKHCNEIFKLDCCLQEIDCLAVHANEFCGAMVTGISFDCKEDRLLVSFANCIVSISTSACEDGKLIQKSCQKWNVGVCSISPSYAVIEICDSKQYIGVYDCHSTLRCKYDIPYDCFIEDIIFNPCTPHCDERHHFYALVTKDGCHSYIWDCVLDCCDLELCICNYKLCDKDCCSSYHSCSSHACNDVIESIALIQTSLSHILNAEGEKLQKILASTDDVEEILRANEAINNTIVKITHLEIILHDKLTAVKECCHICDDRKKTCKEDKCKKSDLPQHQMHEHSIQCDGEA